MRKGAVASALVLTTALAFTGCSSKQGDLGNKNIRTQSLHPQRFAIDGHNEMDRMRGNQLPSDNIVGYRGNTHMALSQQIANKLTARSDVKSAYVILTNHNAYVSIVTERHTESKMGPHVTAKGVPSLHTHINTGTSDHYTHMTSTGAALPFTMKNQIADEVRAMAPGTRSVFVSENPDLYSRMQNYSVYASQGHSLQGFVTEFNALINRVFPEAAGTHVHGAHNPYGMTVKEHGKVHP